MPDPRDILVAARKLIENPEQWLRGAFESKDGSAMCLARAVFNAQESIEGVAHRYDQDAPSLLREVAGTELLMKFNDAPGRTHAEVLALFDRAIEAAS